MVHLFTFEIPTFVHSILQFVQKRGAVWLFPNTRIAVRSPPPAETTVLIRLR